jgi:uncharacterized protein with ParB-like and HNH nuclease domain
MRKKIEPGFKPSKIGSMLGEKNVFCVPDYQRRYSWEKDQWKDLWDDISSLQNDDTHYLGNIVLVSGQYQPGSPPRLDIVDGQQRLVCVSALLIALRDYFGENGEKTRVQNIDKTLKNFDQDGNFLSNKLRLGILDEEDYRYLLENEPKKVKNNLLRHTYFYFMDEIKRKKVKEAKDLHTRLVENVEVVLITVPEDMDAYRLFEGLNDRGSLLSPVDLMKNHLFRISDKTKDVSLDLVKKSWSQIIINLRDIDEERFFRQHMMSSKALEEKEKHGDGKGKPGKVTVTNIYDQFKRNLERFEESVGIKYYLDDIEQSSELYSGICNATIEKFKPPASNARIKVHLRNLSDIGAAPSYTFILRMFSENVDKQDTGEILELVEKFSIRRIIGELPTRELDTIYTHLAHNAFKKENAPSVDYVRKYLSSEDRIPSDENFQKNFEKVDFKNNPQTKYILGEIELRHFRGLKTPDRYSSYYVHIEHIAPRSTYSQKSKSPWKEYLGVSKKEFDRWKSKIGNLVPLEGDKNVKAKYKPFSQKKEYYSASDFKMAKQLCKSGDWSIEKIVERTKELAKIATSIWKL